MNIAESFDDNVDFFLKERILYRMGMGNGNSINDEWCKHL